MFQFTCLVILTDHFFFFLSPSLSPEALSWWVGSPSYRVCPIKHEWNFSLNSASEECKKTSNVDITLMLRNCEKCAEVVRSLQLLDSNSYRRVSIFWSFGIRAFHRENVSMCWRRSIGLYIIIVFSTLLCSYRVHYSFFAEIVLVWVFTIISPCTNTLIDWLHRFL